MRSSIMHLYGRAKKSITSECDDKCNVLTLVQTGACNTVAFLQKVDSKRPFKAGTHKDVVKHAFITALCHLIMMAPTLAHWMWRLRVLDVRVDAQVLLQELDRINLPVKKHSVYHQGRPPM